MNAIQLKDNFNKVCPIPYIPVGFIYQTTSNMFHPAMIFGGIWTQIDGGFLKGCAEDSSDLGTTGGANKVTLSVGQLPLHYHGYTNYNSHNGGTYTGVMENAASYSTKINCTNGATGGGKAHENMPPFYSVYMWIKISDTPDLSITWLLNYSISDSTGEPVATNNYYTTEKIVIEPGYVYTIYGENIGGFSLYPKFYDKNNTFLGTGAIADGHGWASDATGDQEYILNPFQNSKYFRLQGYANDTSIPPTKITIQAVYKG